jgi:hypothetical protein
MVEILLSMSVTLAKAGVQCDCAVAMDSYNWIPAFAGMTVWRAYRVAYQLVLSGGFRKAERLRLVRAIRQTTI